MHPGERASTSAAAAFRFNQAVAENGHEMFEPHIVHAEFSQMVDGVDDIIDVGSRCTCASPHEMSLPFNGKVARILRMVTVHEETERVDSAAASIEQLYGLSDRGVGICHILTASEIMPRILHKMLRHAEHHPMAFTTLVESKNEPRR